MGGVRICAVVSLMTVAAVLFTASASGDAPTSELVADVSRTPGVVDLFFFGRPGSTVYFDERVGASVKRLGSLPIGPIGAVILRDAVVWRCDRVERRFEATEVRSDGVRAYGSYDVRTGSCGQRFGLSAPRRAQLGTVARVRVVDRWSIGGIATRLCVAPPRGRARCRALAFPRAVSVSSRRFRVTSRGLWRIELRVGGHRVRTAVAVGTRAIAVKPAPIVLATGDSTMQGVDSFLADRLGETARVRTDVHPGTGISNGQGWLERARQQALSVKPRTTVISIGAVDDQAMPTPGGTRAECCGQPWLLEYARRVALMMKRYQQRGRGRVLWLALPAPRSELLAAVTAQVDKAILAAAAGRRAVKVLRLDELFTPNGFRDVMRYRGQDVHVRALDGIHLSAAGTAIAAEAIEGALREGW